MASYDWRDYRQVSWGRRYPDGVRGLAAWRLETAPGSVSKRLFDERQRTTAPMARPCLFVSHRQADGAQAARIAYLATLHGFEFWLDVLDPPTLSATGLPNSATTPSERALAVASTIEMALLNSTHVMVVVTPNTRGSQWVPYEYGRVKEPVPITPQAACWVDRSSAALPLPEYLYLGRVTRSEDEIRDWLRGERVRFGGASSGPAPWTGTIPTPI